LGPAVNISAADRGIRNVLFDPASLIRSPFVRSKVRTETFGMLTIQGLGYFKRCRAWFHSQMFRLPSLSKIVIYLDQFALSSIMKALNPHTKPYNGGIDPFWNAFQETR
jgi:hypothetical protein